jgi:hypothetical protein
VVHWQALRLQARWAGGGISPAILYSVTQSQPFLAFQDASDALKARLEGAAAQGTFMQIQGGRFRDDRWVAGRWDMTQFAGADGITDWNKVCLLGNRGQGISMLLSTCFSFPIWVV